MNWEQPLPGNIADIATLRRLKNTPDDKRDTEWHLEFTKALSEALLLLNPEPEIIGPDNFAYFSTCLAPGNFEAGKSNLVPASVLSLGAEALYKGCGIAIFEDRNFSGQPFWVMTYGELFSIIQYGNINGDPQSLDEVEADKQNNVKRLDTGHLPADTEVVLGLPAEYHFSNDMRALYRMVFESHGVYDARIAMVEIPGFVPSMHFVLSLSPDDYPDPAFRQSIMERLLWLTPRSRPIAWNFGLDPGLFLPLDDRDFSTNERLHELAVIPLNDRGDDWYQEVYTLIPNALYTFVSAEPVEDLDGFYYMSAILMPSLPPSEPCPTHTLAEAAGYAIDQVAGLKLYGSANPGSQAFWTLTYGDVFSLQLHGTLDGDPLDLVLGTYATGVANDMDTTITYVDPGPAILSEGAREILRQYFEMAGNAVTLALVTDPAQTPSRQLVVDFNPPLDEEQTALHLPKFQWFLPPSLALISNSRIDKARLFPV